MKAAPSPRPTHATTGPPPPIRFYHWPLWMATLALALAVFYGILTPLWMLIRLVAWLTERPIFNRGRR